MCAKPDILQAKVSRTHSGHVKCGKLQPTPPAITWLWTCWHGGAIVCDLRSQTKSRCHLLQDPWWAL